MDEQNRLLLQMWEEDQRRILAEQQTFKRRIADLGGMNSDLTRIICISEHLANFVNSGALGVVNEDSRKPPNDHDHDDEEGRR